MEGLANMNKIVRISAEEDKEGRVTDRLGRLPFEMIRRFGKGGFGAVWLAQQGDTQVVVKKQPCDKLDYRGCLEWFTLKVFRHENVINAHACYYEPEKKFQLMVMDYASFGDLGHLIQAVRDQGRRFSRDEILKFVC